MPLDPAYLAIAVAVGMLLAIASNRVPQDAAMVGGMVILLIAGVLQPVQALEGFGNPGLITIAVLYVVVAGLRETGSMEWVTQRFIGNPKSLPDALARLAVPTGGLSAFVNNTPVVAIFIPVAQAWSSRFGIPASRLMMPISFIAILTGTVTLIGTSTNLVVDGLMQKELGHPGLSLFSIAPLGIPVAIAGVLYIVLFAGKLLPDRAGAVQQLTEAKQYAFEMRVLAGGPLVGKTLAEVGLRNMPNAYVFELRRGARLVTAVGSDEVLEADDVLVCVGVVDAVADLRRIPGLAVAEDQAFKLDLSHGQRCLVELVVAANAPFVGMSVRESRFRTEYEAAILSISRNGERLAGKVGDIVLQAGDTLLVEASREFAARHRYDRAFLLVSTLQGSTPPDFKRAPLALGILFAMILVSSFDWLSLLEAGFLASFAMLVTGCLSLNHARDSVEWPVLVVIGASFAIGLALERTGAAALIANGMMTVAGRDPFLTLAVVYVATVIFTEFITNNAAAALMFPIGVASATALGVDWLPFAIAIMFGASCSFLTPVGYQTNLMVYGPGGYRFMDYVRFGLPLTLIVMALTLTLAPVFWPL
jgi:di/tricarboxylate transporter